MATTAPAPAPAAASAPAPSAAPADEALNPVSAYDLTSHFLPYLERHLALPLLEFLATQKVYPASEILRGKLDLLAKTSMVDLAEDDLEEMRRRGTASDELYTTSKAELKARREEVMKQYRKVEVEAEPMKAILDNAEKLEKLKADGQFTLEALKAAPYSITEASAQAVFNYAKFRFDCGYYDIAAQWLEHYRMLFPSSERTVTAVWGELAASILTNKMDAAMELVGKLREVIDASRTLTPIEQLEQRTWLLHWSIFVFFKHPNGRNAIVDLFFQDRWLNTVQTTCPYLLRYLTAATIINKRRRNTLKDLVRVLRQESYEHRDPITEFFETLNVNFDFEAAQRKLRECEVVLANDYFLSGVRAEFIENARLFIFETYCRIHQRIDMAMLAEKLGMKPDDAERWIVNLIRNAKIDAKIDSKHGHVVMGAQCPNVYQQVIEKTKAISVRTYVLNHNVSDLASKRAGGPGLQHQRGQRNQQQAQNQQQQQSQPQAAAAAQQPQKGAVKAPQPAAPRVSEEALAESLAAVTADD